MFVDNATMKALGQGVFDGRFVRFPDRLDRKVYGGLNKVLQAAGGKWDAKKKGHAFSIDAVDAIEPILLTGAVVHKQHASGYFPTPPSVVATLLEIAELQDDYHVLEPSAGQGAIVKGVVNRTPGVRVTAYEIDTDNVRVMYADPVLRPRIDAGVVTITGCDCLAVRPRQRYNRIIMNPPFARQSDVHHVMRMFQFLKPGGLLIAVMGAGVRFRDNQLTRDFREMVLANEGDIEELPVGSFKIAGTSVNTVVVTMRAPS